MTVTHVYTAKTLEEPFCLPFDEAVAALENGDVTSEVGLMRWGSNYTFLVNVEYENTRFMGVYKPRQGERPLWDFPDGTLCNRETAAYLTSEALGWRIVPPTMLREGPRGIGSVQLFINHDPEAHFFTFDKSTVIDQLQRMAAFDAVTNNADRKGGHCLIDEDSHIWGIDHGLTFNSSHKLRTVIWDFAGKPIPQDIMDNLDTLCKALDDTKNSYTMALSKLLNDAEIRMIRIRVQRLLNTGTYPLPGSGPNRPWPPV